MDKVFQALASGARRSILHYLQQGEMSAGEIALRFAFSKPALSGHLRILEGAGLIARDKRGQFVYFKLLPLQLEEIVIAWALELYPNSAAALALAQINLSNAAKSAQAKSRNSPEQIAQEAFTRAPVSLI